MALAELEFYYPLPLIGKKFHRQLTPFRDNFNSLASLIRAAIVDISTESGEHDLAGWAIGELDFRNKAQIFWDKAVAPTDGDLKIRLNSGTEAVPVWHDHITIRGSDGRVIIGAGGIQSDAGFYGLAENTIDIEQTKIKASDFNKKIINVNNLGFNAEDFYIIESRSSATKGIVNLRAAGGAAGSSGPTKSAAGFTSAGDWTLTHNLGTTDLVWSVYDDGLEAIIPKKVDVSDPNVAYFYFVENTAGRAVVIG